MRYYNSLGDAGYPISKPCSTMPCSFDEHLARGSRGGVDFAVRTGSPVIAPTKGRVRNWSNASAGNAVDFYHIDDNGRETGFYDQFMHLSAFVSPGVYEPGATIGFSGNTGSSTGPHVHWDLVNPQGRVVRQWEYFREDPIPPTRKDNDMIAVRTPWSGAVYLLAPDYMHLCTGAEWALLNPYYPGFQVDGAGLHAVMSAHNVPIGVENTLAKIKTWSRQVVIEDLIKAGGGSGPTPEAIAKAVDASLKDDFAGIPKSVNDDVAKRMGS